MAGPMAMASPMAAPTPPREAAQALPLYLDVELNGMARGLHAVQQQPDGSLWMDSAALRAIGFVLPARADGPMAVAALADVQARYEAATQRLVLQAPLHALALPTTQLRAAEAEATPAAAAAWGALLNYDVYGVQGFGGPARHAGHLAATTEWRVFGGMGVFSSTALSQLAGDGGSGQRRHVRLDTNWSLHHPEAMRTLRVGDVVTAALPWTRGTRLGGVQWGRDFSLQPLRVNTPLPSFFGSAVLPSEVELLVNGMRYYTGQVPAGPFQLTAPPGVGASGQAQVVLTDALGRQDTYTYALQDVQRLLQPGLTDWSVSLGALRRAYGQRSFDYGRPVATGTWRRGLTPSLTAEAHAEASAGVAVAGAGGVGVLGPVQLNAALAYSRHGGGSGLQLGGGARWTGQRFYASADVMRAQPGYQDVAAHAGTRLAERSARATAGYSDAAIGSLGASYFTLRYAGERATPFASVYWSRPLGRGAVLGLSFTRALGQARATSAALTLSWALDGRTTLNVGAQRANGARLLLADAQRPAPLEGGAGWRVATRQGSGRHDALAEASWRGSAGLATAGLLRSGGATAAYGSATGALVLMGGQVYRSRRVDDAFALVTTSGLAGVPVRLENRPVGRTNAEGHLLVSPLHAWRPNRLSIDPMGLPANLQIDDVNATVVPADRAGGVARFALTPVRAALVVLTDAAGQWLPLGSEVRLSAHDAAAPAVVGFDGETYLSTLAEGANVLHVRLPTGTACVARVAYAASESDTLPRIGPVPCLENAPR
ncbi:MAG: fimbria/pilus outer membrane usher protein [Pseudomonadota bacterium]|nr:fimbria/pilus outer membrane usher protein [Pseudomonadota bacterium]